MHLSTCPSPERQKTLLPCFTSVMRFPRHFGFLVNNRAKPVGESLGFSKRPASPWLWTRPAAGLTSRHAPLLNTRAAPPGIPHLRESLDLPKPLQEGSDHLKVALSPFLGQTAAARSCCFWGGHSNRGAPNTSPLAACPAVTCGIYGSILIRLLQALPLQPVAFAGKQHES